MIRMIDGVTVEELARESRDWVRTHQDLADLVVSEFVASAAWPSRTDLQRTLDRRQIDDQVDEAAAAMPLLPQHAHALQDVELRLPLHLFVHVPAGADVCAAALLLVQRAGQLYLSDVIDPRISSSDVEFAGVDPQVLRAALELIRSSPPHPIGSGSTSAQGWSFDLVASVARRLDALASLQEYVAAQFDLSKSNDPAPVPAPRRPRWFSPRGGGAGRAVHVAGVYGIAAAVIGALVTYFLGLWGPSDGGPPNNGASTSNSSPAPSAASTPGSTKPQQVDDTWLTPENLCMWRLGTHPVPTVTTRPLTLRIDDRCNNPKQVDPKKDQQTSVYSEATRTSTRIATIPDGYLITVRCYVTDGDLTTDASVNSSRIWLGITKPAGFVPDVNIGGGFTEHQLAAYGIDPC